MGVGAGVFFDACLTFRCKAVVPERFVIVQHDGHCPVTTARSL